MLSIWAKNQTQTFITRKYFLPDPLPLISKCFLTLPQLLQTTNAPVFCLPGTTVSKSRNLLKLGQLVTMHHPQLPALLGCPRVECHNPKKLVCWWWTGIGHNLTRMEKSLKLGFFKVSMVPNLLYLLSPSIKCQLQVFFKGMEDRKIKRKHQANILLSF